MERMMIDVEVESEEFDLMMLGFLHFDAHYDKGYPETLYSPKEPAGWEVDNFILLCDWTPLVKAFLNEPDREDGAWELTTELEFIVAGEKNYANVQITGNGEGWTASVDCPDVGPSLELYLSEAEW